MLSVALVLTFAFPFSVFASTHDVNQATYKETKLNFVNPSNDFDNVSTMGAKSKAVLKVIEILNNGGKKLVDLAVDFKVLDKQTGKTLMNNSTKIANFLDKLDGVASDVASMTRTQLPRWLLDNTPIRSKGVAENIAIAISWAIRGADWLFF